VKQKEVSNIVLDPNRELTDIDMQDNVFPKTLPATKFDAFKKKSR
jgi:hypothetical protein